MTARGIVSASHRAMPVPSSVVRRVVRVVAELGEKSAARRLGVGASTLQATRVPGGAVLPSTYARLVQGLDRVELELAEGAREAGSLAEVGT